MKFFIVIFVSIFCLVLLLICTGRSDLRSGCSLAASEDLYFGRISRSMITEVRFIESHQDSFYPIPDWKEARDDLVFLQNREFINSFYSALHSYSDSPQSLGGKSIQSLHIFVKLSNGQTGCLRGKNSNRGFYFGPMFDRDSYGSNRNAVLNVYLKIKEQKNKATVEFDLIPKSET